MLRKKGLENPNHCTVCILYSKYLQEKKKKKKHF